MGKIDRWALTEPSTSGALSSLQIGRGPAP
jgi:hypothetical protein